MRRLRLETPLWLARAKSHRRRRFPALTTSINADVAIVGGGLTGATIALVCAESGLRVALVESALVGHGSTAASSALLMREPDEDFSGLEQRYGAAAARRIWHLSRLAVDDLVITLRRLNISCELADQASVYYTIDAGRARTLYDEYRRRRSVGIGGEWLDPPALRQITGIKDGVGIRTGGNARCDPYRACLGLLQSATQAGARIFERSAARHTTPSRHHIDVVTAHGSIRARDVVVATGYATPAFKPLAGRFKLKHTYVLATEAIGVRHREALGLQDVLLWDMERPYHYARWTADRRLLLGGADQPLVPPRRRRRAFREGTRELRRYFTTLLPGLDGVYVDYAWEGLFALTADGLPYIGPHRRYPRHLFALGYGGNGMTFGILAARLLLERLRGVDSADQRLFAFNRLR